MTPSEPAENESPPDDDVDRKAWSSEELAELARRMLETRSLTDAADAAFVDHPDLTPDAVEYVDEDELKP